MKNLLITCLVAFAIGIMYAIYQRRQKLIKHRILEDEKRLYAKVQSELGKDLLIRVEEMIQDKNQLLERVSNELRELREKSDTSKEGVTDVNRRLETFLGSTIVNENDWQNFRVFFDQAHPGFLTNLRRKYKDLTPSEIRLAALTKLKIPTKEMAFMLNVNKETIHTSRYRLRKKMGWQDTDTDLKDLMDSL